MDGVEGVPRCRCQDLANVEVEAYRQRVKAEEWTRLSLAFPLERGPVFAVLLATGCDRCDLIFTYHHAILDGESARRVLRNVLARYAGERVTPGASFRALCERPAAPVAPLVATLADYVPVLPAPPPRSTGMGDFVWRLFHRLLAVRAWLAARRVRRHAKTLPLAHRPVAYAGGDITSQPLSRALDGAVTASQGATLPPRPLYGRLRSRSISLSRGPPVTSHSASSYRDEMVGARTPWAWSRTASHCA
jgi:hypothetical protein